jgi:hypothetical protein
VLGIVDNRFSVGEKVTLILRLTPEMGANCPIMGMTDLEVYSFELDVTTNTYKYSLRSDKGIYFLRIPEYYLGLPGNN